jgi:GT2 family glycosyltransferase
LNARGKKIVCLPQSFVYHVGGATLKKEHPHKTYLNFRNNLLMLYKNLPNPYYRKVMFVRFFWDYLSAVHFLLQGQFSNVRAIWKARRDFYRLKAQYQTIREKNLSLGRTDLPDTMLRKSIIWEYYFKNKKTFSQVIPLN